MQLDRTEPFVLQRAAMTNLMIGRTGTATRWAEAAARVSACYSEILIIRGLVLACCGDPTQGVSLLERAIELEVGLPPGCASALAEGRHLNRDYAGSLDVLDAIVDAPWYVGLLRAVNLARLGDTAEARRLVHEVPAGINVARFARSEARMCARSEDADHWNESFRLAGVEF